MLVRREDFQKNKTLTFVASAIVYLAHFDLFEIFQIYHFCHGHEALFMSDEKAEIIPDFRHS